MIRYINKKLIARLGILLGVIFGCFYIAFFKVIVPMVFELGSQFQMGWIIYWGVYLSVMALGFMISILWVSKGKRWAVRLLQMVCGFVYIDLFGKLILMSYWSVVGVTAILGFIFSIALFLVCSTKTIRKEFQFKPGLFNKSAKWRAFNRFFCRGIWILIFLLFVSYLCQYYYFYPKRKINYPVQSSNRDWKTYHLLKHSFQAPKDLKIGEVSTTFDKPHSYQMVFLENEDKGIRIGVNIVPGEYVAKIFQYRNSYEFHRRSMRMTRFISQWIPLEDVDVRIEEVNIGDQLDGFLMRGDLDLEREFYCFIIFDKNNRDISGSLGIVFNKKETTNEHIAKQIISSLRLTH